MNDLVSVIGNVFLFVARICLPVLCLLLIFFVIKDLFSKQNRKPIAKIITSTGADFELFCAESIIGRSKICDVAINVPTISRRHAVITYNDEYGFKVSSVFGSKILVNDTEINEYAYFNFGDVLEIGGVQFKLIPAEEKDIYSFTRKPKKRGVISALLLTAIQLIVLIEIFIHYASDPKIYSYIAFGALILIEWIYFTIHKFKDNINIEILGFLLTTFGFAVTSSAAPQEMLKQLITAVVGILAFIVLHFVYRRIDLVMKLRYVVGAVAILRLMYNLFFGINLNGAKNWIMIGSYTFQPSEIVKFMFIFTTSATLQNLLSKRNFILFLGFSAAVLGSLVLMRDFGTCAIFFATVLIILYLRSGDIKIVSGITALTGVGAVLAFKYYPYVQRRFASYLKAWQYASTSGYQQTRTMVAIASGALFGVGGANGILKYVEASDTDIVFGMLCEEWGMLVTFSLLSCFVIFALYSLKSATSTSSAFFSIAACAAAGLWLVQISLNIFGSVDLLPFTGVTMPFISNGGTSMISSWLLLSFIKAVGKNSLKVPSEFISEEEQSE